MREPRRVDDEVMMARQRAARRADWERWIRSELAAHRWEPAAAYDAWLAAWLDEAIHDDGRWIVEGSTKAWLVQEGHFDGHESDLVDTQLCGVAVLVGAVLDAPSRHRLQEGVDAFLRRQAYGLHLEGGPTLTVHSRRWGPIELRLCHPGEIEGTRLGHDANAFAVTWDDPVGRLTADFCTLLIEGYGEDVHEIHRERAQLHVEFDVRVDDPEAPDPWSEVISPSAIADAVEGLAADSGWAGSTARGRKAVAHLLGRSEHGRFQVGPFAIDGTVLARAGRLTYVRSASVPSWPPDDPTFPQRARAVRVFVAEQADALVHDNGVGGFFVEEPLDAVPDGDLRPLACALLDFTALVAAAWSRARRRLS